MNTDRQHELLMAERSAHWLQLLKTAGTKERMAFVRWIKQSPLHVREMLLATTWDTELGRVDAERRIDLEQLIEKMPRNVTPLSPATHVDTELDDQPVSRPERREPAREVSSAATEEKAASAAGTETRARSWKPARLVVTLAAAASVVAALALGWPNIIKGLGLSQQFATLTGEQRAISLSDGSVVFLNAQSSVRVDYSRKVRDVYLDEGQAIFQVAHDAKRPFRVHVDRATVQAIGTQFDVNCRLDHTDVAVIEGLVKVIADQAETKQASDTDVPAGKTVRIAANGEVSVPTDVDVAEVVAWRHRRLVFHNHTLIEIAAEFNRYNKAPKIRVEGEILQLKRYSGVFDADDPESFLQYLAADHRLAFERNGNEFVVIRLRSSYAMASNDGRQ